MYIYPGDPVTDDAEGSDSDVESEKEGVLIAVTKRNRV